MNELQIFKNEQFGEIRTVEIDGEPWFIAADVCRALELSDTGRAIERLDADESTRIEIDHPQSPGKTIEVYAVNEAGLYALILGSRKKEAKAFKRWITHEVIPSIRKHGAYMTDETLDKMIASPEFGIRLLTELKEEREKRIALEGKVKEDKPKVLFAEAVSTAKTSILVGELAKLLKQNGVEIGQNRLFDWMRQNGYLIKRQGNDYNMPTQYSMERGWFEIKETAVTHSDGHVTVNKTPKVTGAGQVYFINLFLGKQSE